jgi:hypothetical protein
VTAGGAVTVACPGCGRHIALPAEELSLTIECACCHVLFVPRPAEGTPRTPAGARVAWLLAGGLAALALIVVAFAAIRAGRPSPPAAELAPPAADRKAGGDPWQECSLIRAYLDKNLNDPAGWEVVEWKSRRPYPEHGSVDFILRFRAKSSLGTFRVYERGFRVKGAAVECVSDIGLTD